MTWMSGPCVGRKSMGREWGGEGSSLFCCPHDDKVPERFALDGYGRLNHNNVEWER